MEKEIEAPYFDSKGVEIKEFAVLKVYHFTGARRKRHYMYKWVRLREFKGKMWWVAEHLVDDSGEYFYLRSVADKETRVLQDSEIVQQY